MNIKNLLISNKKIIILKKLINQKINKIKI